MSARRRKSDLLQTPSSSSRHTEMTEESVQLQQELETLKQVHSSIKALNHMTVTLYKTLEVVVQNSNDLKVELPFKVRRDKLGTLMEEFVSKFPREIYGFE